MTLFGLTFERNLAPYRRANCGAGAAHAGEARGYDDCKPAYFVHPRRGGERQDFARGGPRTILARSGSPGCGTRRRWRARRLPRRSATVTVLFEKSIQMDCAFPPHGKLTVQADDPTRLPESTAALAEGKRRCGRGCRWRREARASAWPAGRRDALRRGGAAARRTTPTRGGVRGPQREAAGLIQASDDLIRHSFGGGCPTVDADVNACDVDGSGASRRRRGGRQRLRQHTQARNRFTAKRRDERIRPALCCLFGRRVPPAITG